MADATNGVLRAFRASPWLGVVAVAFALGAFVQRQNTRLDASEVRTTRVEEKHASLAVSVQAIQSTVDTIRIRQEIVICALEPAALAACQLYRMQGRRR